MSDPRRSLSVIGSLLAALSLTLLVGPPATAAKVPTAGFTCESKDAGKTIQTKAMQKKGLSLVCVADESEEAHEHDKSEKGRRFAHKPQYKWAWWAPPAPTTLDKEFLDLQSRWEAASGKDFNLMDAINAPYSRDETSPCKINGLPISSGSSVSYGASGLFGRDVPGYARSTGTVTIGVVISVPTDYELVGELTAERDAATVSYSDSETVTYPAKTVDYNNIKSRVQNLETYMRDYFLEQSYGKMNVEFKYYPRLLRGNRSVEDMTRDNWMAVAVQAYNAASQVEDSYWESDFSNVTTVWSLIVDKPGSYAARAFREVEAGRDDVVSLQTPIGDFNTTLQTPIPETGNQDKPLIAHEIYHSLRLPDSYQRDSNPVTTRIAGRIGRGASGYSTSGMLGWDRYVSRWLTDDNIECITLDRLEDERTESNPKSTVTLRAIQSPVESSEEKKLAVVPFNRGTQAIVVESWRPIGSDRASALTGRADTAQRGALVYLLNASSNNGLDVTSTSANWPTIDSPHTLYRESLWTLGPDEFPSRLAGCESGTPTAREDNANCSNLMEGLVRQEAFLREDGVRSMEVPIRTPEADNLCTLNPFSPTFTQGQTPWVVLSFAGASADEDVVRFKLECR